MSAWTPPASSRPSGSGVTRFRPGDRVFSNLTEYGYGAFAEYACAPEKAWAPMPASVSFEIAATLPEASIIAYQGLRGGSTIKPGDGVLINGASGNVGPFAVQLAKSFGAEVTGVCRTSKMDFVRSLGADHVIDYTKDDYTRMSPRYDYILDVWARRSLLAPRRVLKPGGRYAMAGGSTGAIFEGLLLGPLLSVGRDRKVGLVLIVEALRPDGYRDPVQAPGGGRHPARRSTGATRSPRSRTRCATCSPAAHAAS